MASSQPSAYGSAKDQVTKYVAANPVAVALTTAALAVGVIFLAYYANKYKNQLAGCSGKSTFITQYPMTGLHSNWQLGHGDAGWGGSLHRETTPQQAAVYRPGLQGAGLERGICNGRENMQGSPDCKSSCGGCCPTVNCGGCWDKGAVVEAQAAAHLGSLPNETNADAGLMATINGASDCVGGSCGLDDQALSELMHNGGAP